MSNAKTAYKILIKTAQFRKMIILKQETEYIINNEKKVRQQNE